MMDARWKGSFLLSICIYLAISLCPACTSAQSSSVRGDAVAAKPVNLDFEDGDPGKVPAGWLATTASTGYLAEMSSELPRSGRHCALLRAEKPTGQFGILMQVVDAAPYRGHRIRLRAALRADGARAQLWLRIDRTGKRNGFFDNMMDRPVTSASWATVEIAGDVDVDAVTLNFGLLMVGTGRTYIDAVALDDLGKLIIVAELARPLAASALANLEAFARLLGYVRHFHPSDAAAATDWDAFAVKGIRQIEAAASPGDLARRLEAIFRPVAPTVRVVVTGQKPKLPKELEPPIAAVDSVIVQWRHKGFGSASRRDGVYTSERIRAAAGNVRPPEGFHDPRKPFSANLPGGVTCAVPLALFADASGTFPHPAPSPPTEGVPVKYSGDDRATRLADVVLAWNVLEHFYPYFDIVKTDWQAELGRALKSAATDANEEAFTITLRRMVTALRDGHGGVQGPSAYPGAALPVLWSWIENQLVVIAVAPNGSEGLKPGMVVETIDSKPSREAVEDLERLISSATPQWARYRALQELRAGSDGSVAMLGVRTREGQHKTVSLKRTAGAAVLAEPRPEKIAEVQPGIVYVDISRISDADFKAALPKFEQARGLVFDMRGYPGRLSPELLQHLTDTPIRSAQWKIPIISDPDWTGAPEWGTDGRWDLQPVAPRFKAKIAFVTDGRAISYAESWMGMVEAYKLGEIVGETTAGTNGNVNPLALPGGYTIYWTGMKVLKHNGSRHHGVGIAPTVPVSRTIRGVTEGRDEQVERAIAIVNGGI